MSQAINNTTPPPPPPPPPSGPYAPTVVADGPAGYWRLDETSGTTAANSASGGTAGTYSERHAGRREPAAGRHRQGGVVLRNERTRPGRVEHRACHPRPRSPSKRGSSRPRSPRPARSGRSRPRPSRTRCSSTDPSWSSRSSRAPRTRRLQAPSALSWPAATYHVVGTYDGTTHAPLRERRAGRVRRRAPARSPPTRNALYIGSWNGSSEFFAGTIDEVAVYPERALGGEGHEPLHGRHQRRAARAEPADRFQGWRGYGHRHVVAGGHQLWCDVRGVVQHGFDRHPHGGAGGGLDVRWLVGWRL